MKALWFVLVALVSLSGTMLEAADTPPPFYAQACFFGPSNPQYPTLDAQMKLLSELGYAGYAHFTLEGLNPLLEATDKHQLKLFQLYVFVSLAPNSPWPYHPRLKEVLPSLKGRDTILGLMVIGQPASDTSFDAKAVSIVQEIADLAGESGLRVVLYPYKEAWIERTQDAVRIARKTERKNVGVAFNEAQYFQVDTEEHLEATLKEAGPLLWVVNLSGTDGSQSKETARLIQPLDRGAFDNHKLLQLLRQQGYQGPIGFHGFKIAGDPRENLSRSIEAWRKLWAETAAGK